MLTKFKTSALIALAALGLSGCVTTLPVSRDVPLEITPSIEAATQDWSIESFRIEVPETLVVSEANGYKPSADIVWREDPIGDRYQQVEALMRAALEPVMVPRDGASTPVVVVMEITRFHALTERTRYTIGGEHEIEFDLTVFHADTGLILSGPRHVDLTFEAYGGQRALEAEAQGITQRVRITGRLQDWVAMEFPAPSADYRPVAELAN